MEIYVQEVGALQFLPRLEESVKKQILQGVALFPWNLDLAWRLQAAQVPETIWFVLFKSEAGLSTHVEAWREEGRWRYQCLAQH